MWYTTYNTLGSPRCDWRATRTQKNGAALFAGGAEDASDRWKLGLSFEGWRVHVGKEVTFKGLSPTTWKL